jgi:hypothetical protein
MVRAIAALFFMRNVIPFYDDLKVFSCAQKAHNFVYILYKLAHDPQSGNILYVLFQSGQVDIPDFRLFQYAFLCFDTSRNEFDGGVRILIAILLADPLQLNF